MTYVVVVADRIGDDGMELMRKTAELSVVTTVGHQSGLQMRSLRPTRWWSDPAHT